jgi:hypothetical protein
MLLPVQKHYCVQLLNPLKFNGLLQQFITYFLFIIQNENYQRLTIS